MLDSDSQADRFLRRGTDQGERALELPADERRRLLRNVPLFRSLDADQLETVARLADIVRFRPGEALVRQGEPGECVYLIADGRVEVLVRTEQNGAGETAEAVVSWLVAGDAVGELSLLDGQPRSATCVAVTATTCLRLGRAEFLAALERHWELSRSLFTVLAQRLRLADQLIAEHARDPLTGLNNRRALLELYEREASRTTRAVRQGGVDSLRTLGVLFADIDRFKQINDTYGHQVGDSVLRSVALTLTAVSRATDLVARYGGDEFVVLLPDSGSEGVDTVARRVRQILSEKPPGPVPFSVSIGTATVDPRRPQALDLLLAEADKAMYRDKARLPVRSGRR